MNQLQLEIFSIGEHTGQEMARDLRQGQTHTNLSKKEAGKRNVDLCLLREF